MGLLSWIFGKKKKAKLLPYRYCVAVYSDAALHSGILDDYLKKILVIEAGKVKEAFDYTDDVFEAFAKFIPAYDRTKDVEFENLPILAKDDPAVVSYEVGEDYEPRL